MTYPMGARAQQVEKSLPASPRVTINLSAGMPGQSQWLYVKDEDSSSVTSPTFAATTFNDSTWTPVGIPYSANLLTSSSNSSKYSGCLRIYLPDSVFNRQHNNTDGVGGVENLAFPTVKGRYVRMYGDTRATQYGYSLYELQIYNIAQCGGSGERYTVLSPTLVKDNVSGLTWQRAETTYASGGAQYTQAIAKSYCSSQSMRLPTQSEALAISSASTAACAFPNAWNTWTSTADPSNSNDAAFVTSTGQSSYQVANNYPGAVLCDSGTSVTPTLVITTQPSAQSVAEGQTATFSVVAAGAGNLTYQWLKNGAAISGATSASYTTPATVASDNGALFSLTVTDSTGATVTSNSVALTVVGSSGSGTDAVAINSGGAVAAAFAADEDFSGGGTASTTNNIKTTGVANAAPEAVYQSERAGVFTYTVPGLTAGMSHTVRLHFAEFYFTKAGQRIFNVAINGTTVFPNFDIIAAAGAANLALVETFTASATSSGQIVISFIAGSADQPKVSGIEILQSAGASTVTITTQPAPQSVSVGQTATFSVAATCSGTLTYQWSKNGTAIAGATAASYTTPATVSTDNGALFSVRVTCSNGATATSNSVALTVSMPREAMLPLLPMSSTAAAERLLRLMRSTRRAWQTRRRRRSMTPSAMGSSPIRSQGLRPVLPIQCCWTSRKPILLRPGRECLTCS